MLSLALIMAAIAVMGLSGLPACLLRASSGGGQRVSASLMAAGGVLGLLGLAASLQAFFAVPVVALPLGSGPSADLAWALPWGSFAVAVDPISALFLALVFIVTPLGSIFGLGYWKQSEHEGNGRRLGLFYGILAAAMALVLVARDGMLFLIAWEIMALAAYFASTAESTDPAVRKAGWIYLIATHVGTLCLFAMFACMRSWTDSFAFGGLGDLPTAAAGVIFVLALVGFGMKAGLMPLHLWLPAAHANAPSHVSAVMSGVMLKMGVYGIVRITSLLPPPADWWGGVLLGVGVLSGLAGILFSIGQGDLKRALAYSSVENVGIITMGIGLGLLGRHYGRWDWVVLGMGGAFLHCLGHGLFKPLLFLGSGAIIHGTGTREMDRMGGLAKVMPKTAALFALGAVAICALPPLNGFASEWLLYLGFFGAMGAGGGVWAAGGLGGLTGALGPAGAAAVGAAGPSVGAGAAAASAAVALAAIGALALACFVKIYGSVFLGSSRAASSAVRGSEHGGHAHEPAVSMVAPMAVLAAACVFLGLFPGLVAPFLDKAIEAWALQPEGRAVSLSSAPFFWITRLGLGLLALAAALAVASRLARRGKKAETRITWDCGYAAPLPTMEYTGSSIAGSIVRLFSFVLWPKSRKPKIEGAFPAASRFEKSVPDPVLDRVMAPLFALADRHIPKIRVFQQGQTQLYVLYVVVITIVLLVFTGLGA